MVDTWVIDVENGKAASQNGVDFFWCNICSGTERPSWHQQTFYSLDPEQREKLLFNAKSAPISSPPPPNILSRKTSSHDDRWLRYAGLDGLVREDTGTVQVELVAHLDVLAKHRNSL